MSDVVGRSATDRTHLSIREVLDLLVGEFPDVTISKIRFLESRGLIHPERTPSGYRKFYEHDVERLRWILRQQREHFLPLKVIKGRLDNSAAPSLFDADAFGGDAVPASGPGAAPEEAPKEAAVLPPEVDVSPAARPGKARTTPAREPTPVGQPAASGDVVRSEPGPVPTAPGAGLCFSAGELASACGAEESLVAELEEFGLLAGRTVAGVRVYDEDDLAIVRQAAGLRRFGIEARHLRMFKRAAEREAGLYALVVTPLLRQRNPEARERAERDLLELAELGARLQAIFVRAVLGDLTGG